MLSKAAFPRQLPYSSRYYILRGSWPIKYYSRLIDPLGGFGYLRLENAYIDRSFHLHIAFN